MSQQKLTPALLASTAPAKKHVSEIVEANLSNRGITAIDDISVAVNLHKLVLTYNGISDAKALKGLEYNTELTLLNLANNKLTSFEGLQTLRKLLVLNLSHNEVNHISHHVMNLTALKALILNHNHIKLLDNLQNLRSLTTLVVSHNNLEELSGIGTLTALEKLSAAHNKIRLFPDLSVLNVNQTLEQLRLNDNKITTLPEKLLMPLATSLKILDLGNNLLKDVSACEGLSCLRSLDNLNLKGNPLTKEDGYRERILGLVPTLRILDGERFDPKYVFRKKLKEGIKRRLENKARREERKREREENVEAGSLSSAEEASSSDGEKRSITKKRREGDRAESDRTKVAERKRGRLDGDSETDQRDDVAPSTKRTKLAPNQASKFEASRERKQSSDKADERAVNVNRNRNQERPSRKNQTNEPEPFESGNDEFFMNGQPTAESKESTTLRKPKFLPLLASVSYQSTSEKRDQDGAISKSDRSKAMNKRDNSADGKRKSTASRKTVDDTKFPHADSLPPKDGKSVTSVKKDEESSVGPEKIAVLKLNGVPTSKPDATEETIRSGVVAVYDVQGKVNKRGKGSSTSENAKAVIDPAQFSKGSEAESGVLVGGWD
ncbi:hypothetical protein BJ742DRAFT_795874 [Cladochytrium replicatum]|nr:hypothetical protein BJ742DRAFT_795874 [Cladochytrium replicatum]